jgi:hypothetical protein
MDKYEKLGEPDNYTADDYNPNEDPESAQNRGVE